MFNLQEPKHDKHGRRTIEELQVGEKAFISSSAITVTPDRRIFIDPTSVFISIQNLTINEFLELYNELVEVTLIYEE